jgi:two-component system OmpR family response regulator
MRILLVEDDAALAQAVLGYLHSKQFKVDLAPDLTTARALVAVTHYATILLDLNLPDGDGLELLQHLPRRDDPHRGGGDRPRPGQRPHPRPGHRR